MFSKVVCLVLFLSTYFVRAMEKTFKFKAFELQKAASGNALVQFQDNDVDISVRELNDAISNPDSNLIKFVADHIKLNYTPKKGGKSIKGKDVKIYGYTGKVSTEIGIGFELKERFSGGSSNNFEGKPFEEDEDNLLRSMLTYLHNDKNAVVNVYFYPVDPPKDKNPGSKKCCC